MGNIAGIVTSYSATCRTHNMVFYASCVSVTDGINQNTRYATWHVACGMWHVAGDMARHGRGIQHTRHEHFGTSEFPGEHSSGLRRWGSGSLGVFRGPCAQWTCRAAAARPRSSVAPGAARALRARGLEIKINMANVCECMALLQTKTFILTPFGSR